MTLFSGIFDWWKACRNWYINFCKIKGVGRLWLSTPEKLRTNHFLKVFTALRNSVLFDPWPKINYENGCICGKRRSFWIRRQAAQTLFFDRLRRRCGSIARVPRIHSKVIRKHRGSASRGYGGSMTEHRRAWRRRVSKAHRIAAVHITAGTLCIPS